MAWIATFLALWSLACPPGLVEAIAPRRIQGPLQSLDRNSGTGHAILDTEKFFPEPMGREIAQKYPSSTIVLRSPSGRENGMMIPRGGTGARLSTNELAPFEKYVDWMTKKLNETLPADEQLVVSVAEVRISKAGEKTRDFLDWHQDGNYMVAAVSILGPGTVYLKNSPRVNRADFEAMKPSLEQRTDLSQAPRGKTLVLSASDRWDKWKTVPATAHRSPDPTEDRVFLIVRFKKRS